MRAKNLESVDAIIDALGGNSAVGRMVDRGRVAVWKWRSRNAIPPEFYSLMLSALKERGYSAPARLWQQTDGADERMKA